MTDALDHIQQSTTRPQPEVSMVGFAVAEHFVQADSELTAELLSLYVLPAYRQQGIGTTLVRHFKNLLVLASPWPASHSTH